MKSELLVAYLDGELTSEEERQLEVELEQNVQFQRLLSELCYQRLDYVEAYRNKIISSPSAIASHLPEPRQKNHLLSPRQPRPNRFSTGFWGSLAASILIFVGVFFYTSIRFEEFPGTVSSQVVSRLVKAGSNVRIVHLGKKFNVAGPTDIHDQDRVIVPNGSYALIQYTDGSLVKLRDKSIFQVVGGTDGRYSFLHTGKLSAKIAAQSKSNPMTFSTPDGEIVVLGTEFDLQVRPKARGTYLQMFKGSVLFRNYHNHSTLQLKDAEWAMIASKIDFVSRLGSPYRYKDGKQLFESNPQSKWIMDKAKMEYVVYKGASVMRISPSSSGPGTVAIKIPSLQAIPSKALTLEFEVASEETSHTKPQLVMDEPKIKTEPFDKRLLEEFKQPTTSGLDRWNRWRYELDYFAPNTTSEWHHIRLYANGRLVLDEWGEGNPKLFQMLIEDGSVLLRNVRVIERIPDTLDSDAP
jgi:hypothetical protein